MNEEFLPQRSAIAVPTQKNSYMLDLTLGTVFGSLDLTVAYLLASQAACVAIQPLAAFLRISHPEEWCPLQSETLLFVEHF